MSNEKRAFGLLITVLCVLLIFVGVLHCHAQSVDLELLKSNDPTIRMQTFYALVQGGLPSDATSRAALIELLSRETAYIKTFTHEDDSFATYYSNLVGVVASFHDVRSLPALADLIDTGRIVTDSIASLGTSALDLLVSRSMTSDVDSAMGIAVVLNTMLAKDNVANVTDPVSLNKIRVALEHLSRTQHRYTQDIVRQAQKALGAIFVIGDLNGDLKVDCDDVAIVQASFGKRTGQASFDVRADVNLDGGIDIRDLAFVSQKLPPGTRCQ